MTPTEVLTPATVWLLVIGAVLFYFFTKIRKMYKLEQIKYPKTTLLGYLGQYLKAEWEDILLAFGIAIWILTGHTIAGFEINLSTYQSCIVTGVAIPYLAVNLVLQVVSAIPGIDIGDRSRKRLTKKK